MFCNTSWSPTLFQLSLLRLVFTVKLLILNQLIHIFDFAWQIEKLRDSNIKRRSTDHASTHRSLLKKWSNGSWYERQQASGYQKYFFRWKPRARQIINSKPITFQWHRNRDSENLQSNTQQSQQWHHFNFSGQSVNKFAFK